MLKRQNNIEIGNLSDEDDEQEKSVAVAEDEEASEEEEESKVEEHPLLKSLLETGKIQIPTSLKKVNVPKANSIAKQTRPSTQQMVDGAIRSLNERSGSSIQAIKSYLTSKYIDVDIDKNWLYIKKYLKRGVESGKLVQVRGTGARGSFKLAETVAKEKAVKKKEQQERRKLKLKQKRAEESAKPTTADSKQKKLKVTDKKASTDKKTTSAAAAKTEPRTKQAAQKPQKITADAVPDENAVPTKKSKQPPKTTTGKGATAKPTKPARKSITISAIKQPSRSKTAKPKPIAAASKEQERPTQRAARNGTKAAAIEQPELAAKQPRGKANKK